MRRRYLRPKKARFNGSRIKGAGGRPRSLSLKPLVGREQTTADKVKQSRFAQTIAPRPESKREKKLAFIQAAREMAFKGRSYKGAKQFGRLVERLRKSVRASQS